MGVDVAIRLKQLDPAIETVIVTVYFGRQDEDRLHQTLGKVTVTFCASLSRPQQSKNSSIPSFKVHPFVLSRSLLKDRSHI
ncbi:MAG: hypothetical protein CL913_04180 [Deltaproteobacteria bacterium]|nr:hypothetical protein [Deltaproteobacteria bacterium]